MKGQIMKKSRPKRSNLIPAKNKKSTFSKKKASKLKDVILHIITKEIIQ